MRGRRLSKSIGNFSFSMLDIMACTVGFLLFLLFILAIIAVNLNHPISESELISSIERYQEQKDKLSKEYEKKQNEYKQVFNEYEELKKIWSFWKDLRIYLFLLLLCIWMFFLLLQESKNKLHIQYSDYVIGSGQLDSEQYIIRCLPNKLIIEQEGITITLEELKRGYRTAFHNFCDKIKNKPDAQIILLMHNEGNATCVQAERIAYKMGVGDRTVIIPMEE